MHYNRNVAVKGVGKLRQGRHKAALTNLLQTENWHMDTRKCIQVKLTEWGLEMGTKEIEGAEGEEEGEGAEYMYIPEDEEDLI